MKLVDRLVLQETVPVFIVSIFLFTGSVWVADNSVAEALKYIAQGIPLWIVVEVIGMHIPFILALTFPMAMLIASILAFTRLSEGSEAVALLASGVSFYRLLAPLMVFACLITAINITFNNTVVPAANKMVLDLRTNVIKDVKRTTQPFSVPPIRNKQGRLEATVWVEGGYDPNIRAMRDVTIVQYDPATQVPMATLFAGSAQWALGPNWLLKNVRFADFNNGVTGFSKEMSTRDIQITSDTALFLEQNPETLNFAQLSRQIRGLRAAGGGNTDTIREAEFSLWSKISLPCATLVFVLVGAPLGLRPQRATGRGVAIAQGIALIFGYYALYNYVQILADSGTVSALLAAWIPNLVGVVASVWMVWRAPT